MKIIKKINNNVVFGQDKNNKEIIVIGKGLGFHKTPYELTDESLIERVYVNLNYNDAVKMFQQLPLEDIILTEEIINEGKQLIGNKLNENLLLTLSDHISFVLERYNESINIKSPLEWQIRQLYPREMEVGKRAVEIINKKRQICLPESEAAFIALHFINSQNELGSISDTTKLTNIMSEIITIVKYFYKCDFDETSINFSRFTTHLQYFIIRQIRGIKIQDGNEELYENFKSRFRDEERCIDKIEKFLYKNFGWICSEDEKFYLILHLQRLVSREKEY